LTGLTGDVIGRKQAKRPETGLSAGCAAPNWTSGRYLKAHIDLVLDGLLS
jgi:hypothetical protein